MLQIDACAGKNSLFSGGKNPPTAKLGSVCLVFKENRFRFVQGHLVKGRDKGGKPLFLKGSSQPLHIGAVGDSRHSAGQAAVDIGFNGIGNDQVRTLGFQQGPVGMKQVPVCFGVQAPPVHVRLDAPDAQRLEVLLMAHKGHAQHHFMVFSQLLDQLQAEPVEHVGVIGYDQNLAHLPAGSFSSGSALVPPSTTPSC